MISKASFTDFSNVDGSSVLTTINRVLPPWVSLILVIAIGWQIANVVWLLVPAPAAGDAVIPPANLPATSSAGGPRANVQAIADNHMFGEADADAAPPVVAEVADDNLSDTRLTNLVLKGTIASDIAEYSVAVIADGTAEQRVYAVGESVGSGATLHAVYAERVVLNENGVLTNLRLPLDFPSSAAAPVRRTTTTTRQTTRDNNANSLQNVVTQNLSKLTDVIRPTPYSVDGEVIGYRVYPGRDRQKFAALGLRPGDTIKTIDGQPLTDPTQAMQIFQSLGTAEQVSVTVDRNGKEEQIVLKTSQLSMGDESTQ